MKKQEKDHFKDQKNPHTKYPEPPFPKQRQEYPGTEAAMIPKADHGRKVTKGQAG
ncbi:hypothetical protein [Dyadobacter diqingensis]|uniref:hypothetical protein n=1 Tax=Dyadobacter diqingensis TaxID=2938121 RepID=UPI00286E8C4B|nr:hypothetical protein [Dyadobacter diqingensis]